MELDAVEQEILGELNQQQAILQMQQHNLDARTRDFARMVARCRGLDANALGDTHEIIDGVIKPFTVEGKG